ncbi:hypothetical protein CTheo_8933 [Ceratobasidium theobromae]|uniref:CCHC-type domain-containing protein n=1 Tax=Ceratobasidium theobromae TaxID=1582974 RepID=A0A5N5Q8A1_9AGAM|nr:hypothetical protein CTheo_8933 [Ceratobasidium theobromae]
MEEMRGDQISSTAPSTSLRDSYQEDLDEGIADQEPTQPQMIVTSIPPSQLSTSSISSVPLGEPVQSSVPAHYTSQYGILHEKNISLRNRPSTPRPPTSSYRMEPSERTGTPNSLLLDHTSDTHISSPPSPAESELSITSSAASRVIHAPITQSTPRRSQILLEEEPELVPSRRVSFPGEGQHFRDPPPHTAFVTRRTSIGTRRASGRPMVQPESFTRVSVIPEEEEVTIPIVPPKSRTSTEVSQHTPEEPPGHPYLKEPPPPQQISDINLSRRGIPIVQEVASRMCQEPITRHNHLPDHIQSRILTSRRLKEMFDDPPPRPPLGGYPPEDPDPYGYSYDDDSSDHRFPPRRPRPPSGPPRPPGPPAGPDPYVNPAAARPVRPFRPAPVHFDTKLKTDLIPEWDGDPKVLPKWVIAVNNIAEYSEYARQQLGQQVPLRFTGRAQRWFTALNRDTRRNITQDWPSLRQAITIHFMNRAYLEQNKREALEMKYRDSGHRNETPEDYVIRKMEALTLFNDWTDPELIFQIMNDAPSSWCAYIDTEDIRSWEEFLDKIYWHQQDLMSGALSNQPDISNLVHRMESALHKLERRSNKALVRSHKVEIKPPWKKKNKPIGWHKDNPKPQFRKHDEVISKGKTPKDKGARGCRHCGSLNHWDRDCPEARNNSRFMTMKKLVTKPTMKKKLKNRKTFRELQDLPPRNRIFLNPFNH